MQYKYVINAFLTKPNTHQVYLLGFVLTILNKKAPIKKCYSKMLFHIKIEFLEI